MTTNQIYAIINGINDQALGGTAIKAVNTSSFVSTGRQILNSKDMTEGFLETLVQRIGRTVLVNRAYKSHLAGLVKGEIEFGSIIQKLDVNMPVAEVDESIPLVNGQSVDQWKVALPEATQVFFYKRSPWQMHVTIQRRWLVEAFLSETAMNAFISLIFVKVQNKLEMCIENMVRMAMCNYACLAKPAQTINLVTMYNADSGNNVPTGREAMFDKGFMGWVAGILRELGRDMGVMSKLYNYAGADRFTPASLQNLAMLSRFKTQLETTALATAFNDDYFKIVSTYSLPFWQNAGSGILDYESKSTIECTPESPDGTASAPVTLTNVIGMVFDDDALGMFRKYRDTQTTPLNAAGLYTNTYWHEDNLWFNALDENFVLLTLN